MSRSPRWAGSAGAAIAISLAAIIGAQVAIAQQDAAGVAKPPSATASAATGTATSSAAAASAAPAAPATGAHAEGFTGLEEPELPPAVEDGIAFIWKLIQLAALLAGMSALGFLAVRVLGPRFSPLLVRPGDLIKVVDQKRLDGKTALYVVEVAGKHALLAVNDHEVRALSELCLDDERIRAAVAARAAERGTGGSFAQALLTDRRRLAPPPTPAQAPPLAPGDAALATK